FDAGQGGGGVNALHGSGTIFEEAGVLKKHGLHVMLAAPQSAHGAGDLLASFGRGGNERRALLDAAQDRRAEVESGEALLDLGAGGLAGEQVVHEDRVFQRSVSCAGRQHDGQQHKAVPGGWWYAAHESAYSSVLLSRAKSCCDAGARGPPFQTAVRRSHRRRVERGGEEQNFSFVAWRRRREEGQEPGE